MTQSIKKVFSVLFVVMATASCGMQEDSEYVKLYKCEQSAMYLLRNEDLMRKATSWKSQMLPQPGSRDDLMRRVEENNKAMSEVMDGNGALKKQVLLDWYNSDYCKIVLKEYQDYEIGEANRREAEIIAKNKEVEEAIARQVANYSGSLVNADSKEVSCSKFKEQVDITFNNSSTSKFRNELQSGLRTTIKDSSFKLKKFQKEYMESQIADDQIEAIAKSIYRVCQDDSLLSDQIGLSDFVRNQESPRSIQLRRKLHEIQNDRACGELSEVYCLADLRRSAGRAALEVSQKCDLSDNIDEGCQTSADEIFTAQLVKIELEELSSEKSKYERYIENPSNSRLFNSANAQGNIYLLMEKCKRSALDNGLRDAEYQKYVKEVCEPKAKLDFVSPQVAVLNKIIQRMEQINK